ncbi:MAG TPA: hypothetical protein VEK82_04495 [Stellaceae bacterium]|nr:hypothetical protein [Stellaceae bacterium]
MPLHRSGVTLFLSWIAPLAFMGVGYAFFPPLRTVVTLPWQAPGDIWIGLFVQLILVFLWMMYEIWYTTHRNTSVAQLQADAAGDITMALALVATGAGLVAEGSVPWWFVVPLLGAIIDVYQSLLLGINNAAEKPFFSPRGAT